MVFIGLNVSFSRSSLKLWRGVCTGNRRGALPLSGLGSLTIFGNCIDGEVVGIRWRLVTFNLGQSRLQLLVEDGLLLENVLQESEGRLQVVYLVFKGSDLSSHITCATHTV
jgi:hypothetical protein